MPQIAEVFAKHGASGRGGGGSNPARRTRVLRTGKVDKDTSWGPAYISVLELLGTLGACPAFLFVFVGFLGTA